jgi:hypothetical protein
VVRRAVEVAHVAGGEPLDASREAVRGQRSDDQFHRESSRVDVDGCQRFARTALVRRQWCQHSCQAMDSGMSGPLSGRAQQPLVGPPELVLRPADSLSAIDVLVGQVTFGPVGCGRDGGVGQEPQHVGFAVAQAFEQRPGRRLLALGAGGAADVG